AAPPGRTSFLPLLREAAQVLLDQRAVLLRILVLLALLKRCPVARRQALVFALAGDVGALAAIGHRALAGGVAAAGLIFRRLARPLGVLIVLLLRLGAGRIAGLLTRV